jgi:hypothetical protein
LLCDDVESEQNSNTPESAEKLFDWFFGDAMPMLDPNKMRKTTKMHSKMRTKTNRPM